MSSIFSFFILTITSCLISSSLAGFAIDFAGSNITSAQFSCLQSNGVDVVISRVYSPDGFIEETGIQNLINAYNGASFLGYNAYITPCVANCSNNVSSGYDQVSAVVNRLNAEINKVNNMFIWVNIDISQPWSKNQNENREFMNEVVLALFKFNGVFGVISNNNSWSTIFGADYNVNDIAEYLIWVKWNGKQVGVYRVTAKMDNFEDLTTDWVPFGGWSSPFVHQYAGGITSNKCVPGVKLNYNYFADVNSGPLMNTKVQKSINKRRLHRFNRKQYLNTVFL